ncbi:protein unc-50 like protein [Quercus suber]|uniref:Protein unc-50 like protein n=1 Tax=Quercus suber TaxID=58331 RepID=A0AAW0J8U7_QUESU
MLPTVSKGRSQSSSSRANPMFPQYLRRIVKVSNAKAQLNYLFAYDYLQSLVHLIVGNKWILNIPFGKCFTYAPHQKLSISTPSITSVSPLSMEWSFTSCHLVCVDESFSAVELDCETKNQWARDDPAFVVICSFLLTVATLAYCAAYDHSAAHAVYVVISVLLFHFLVTGVVLATCCWLYAFDVHCNSFFPMFVLLYVIHYFLSPLLVAHGFIPILLSNLLYMVAGSYYHYLNFLGYDVLPFLERTTFFLYPIGAVIVLSPILILSGFNPSRYLMNMYFSQRL